MDIEEVIKWLMIMKANLNSFPEVSNAKKIEALGEAIRFLKNEESSSSEKPNKSEIPTSSADCISREQALDLLCKKCPVYDCIRKCVSYKAIEKMSSVTPIRPKGHWIMTSDYLTTAYGSVHYVKCSCCGEDSLEEGDYCPNCGAEMCEVEE